MTKPELGIKRDCPQCGARFYDLNREPAHCPKCEHSFVPEALLKPRKPRREDEADKPEAARPAAETSLETADKEAKAAASKRKAGLDEEAIDDEDEIEDIDVDIDVEIEDDDAPDDTLLEDDEDDDVSGIVSTEGGDEEV